MKAKFEFIGREANDFNVTSGNHFQGKDVEKSEFRETEDEKLK